MTIRNRMFLSLAGSAVLGALLSGLASPTSFWLGFLPAFGLLALSFFALLTAWQWAGGGRALAWLVALAFLTRLVVGLTLSLVLPVYGHDEPEQNAGYHFTDAYRRDQQAWALAQSDRPIWASFGEEFASDQYGGLLSISAAVYRYLSPDVQRPYLILILGAFVTALGVPFFWKAVRQRWGAAAALLAAWILVLYPDGIFFGSSQMREPFLLGLVAVAFWGITTWDQQRRGAALALALSMAGMALISSRVAVAVLGVLVVWFYLDYLAPRSSRWRLLGWAAMGVTAIGLLYFTGNWLRYSMIWDSHLTVTGSGWVQRVIDEAGAWFRLPFITGYGLAQPVLPAAIAAPTLPVWKIIIVLRSLGWYLLAPLLIYGFFTVWKAPVSNRRILIWLAVLVVGWILISSARAGGDMTDNPRYRSIFLPWMALLAAWAVRWAWQQRDAWLVRWLVVEAIFLAYFTSWYLSRYYQWWGRPSFWSMLLQITVLSALVLASGWLWNLGKRLRSHQEKRSH